MDAGGRVMQEQLPRVKRGADMDGGMQICREQKTVGGSQPAWM